MNFDMHRAMQSIPLSKYKTLPLLQKVFSCPLIVKTPAKTTIFLILFHCRAVLPFLNFCVNGIIYYIVCCVQLLLLSGHLKDYPYCCTYHQFLFIAWTVLPCCLYHNFCMHFPLDRHLGCFQLLTVTVKSAVNIFDKSFVLCILISLG